MTRFATIALLLPALLAQGTKPSPSPSPTPEVTFPSQVELVIVDAVVNDKKGGAVAGLTKDDFIVTEDGVPQSLVSFEAVQVPAAAPVASPPPPPRIATNIQPPNAHPGRSFLVVFDNIHLTPAGGQRIGKAIAALFLP